MKSTHKIKKELISTIERIDKLEKEMNDKGIAYEDSRNHFKIQPGEKEWELGTTYCEMLGELITKKRVLEFVLS